MINLLPDDTKKQIKAARSNVSLVRYIVIITMALVFLALACTAVYFSLINSKDAADTASINIKTENSARISVENQARSLRTNLANAKVVLDREIRYSEIITDIASALPPGVILDSLTLDNTTLGTPITLQARATNTDAALHLRDNFEASTRFSGFNLQSLSTSPGGSSDYPVSISINIVISKGSAL